MSTFMKKAQVLVLLITLFISACDHNEDETSGENLLDIELASAIRDASPTGSLSHFILPLANDLASIPQDPNNPLTENKVELGKLLFHETALGNNPELPNGTRTYSCASCHHVEAGFQAGIQQGIGDGGSGFGARGEARVPDATYSHSQLDIQPIRTPTALNVAYQDVMLWNGQFGGTGTNAGTEANWIAGTPIETNHLGYQGVEIQAIAGFNVHRQIADDNFYESLPEYEDRLIAAFPNLTEEEKLSNVGIGLAIGAYERTLLPNEAPFQKWLKGQKAELGDAAKRGALVFFGKGQCSNCHTGPALNSTDFYALGMKDLDALLTDNTNPGFVNVVLGRGGFTKNPNDEYKFKVPQLYNLADHNFFGHGATFESILEVVTYKNRAVVEKSSLDGHANIAEDFIPLNLNSTEINDLVVFLTEGLYDPKLSRYVPDEVLSGGCFPVADEQSKIDMGCN